MIMQPRVKPQLLRCRPMSLLLRRLMLELYLTTRLRNLGRKQLSN